MCDTEPLVDVIERVVIMHALGREGHRAGRMDRVRRLVGISSRTLRVRLRRWGFLRGETIEGPYAADVRRLREELGIDLGALLPARKGITGLPTTTARPAAPLPAAPGREQ